MYITHSSVYQSKWVCKNIRTFLSTLLIVLSLVVKPWSCKKLELVFFTFKTKMDLYNRFGLVIKYKIYQQTRK